MPRSYRRGAVDSVLEFGSLSQCAFSVKKRLALTEKALGFETLQLDFLFFQESDMSNSDDVRARHFVIEHDTCTIVRQISVRIIAIVRKVPHRVPGKIYAVTL